MYVCICVYIYSIYIHTHIFTYIDPGCCKKRAGLKVCPERDEGRLEAARFTARVQCFMTLVHLRVTMCHVKFYDKSVGKMERLQTSCGSAFSRFSLFLPSLECSYVILPQPCALHHIVCILNEDPNRNMINCSMGPGDFGNL